MNNQNTGRSKKQRGTIAQPERFGDNRHDPYRRRQKLPEPTVCPDCGVAFAAGRWAWPSLSATAGPEVNRSICPACQRIKDGLPAGIVDLVGAFVVEKAEEIRNLVRNVEGAEKSKRPLERVMEIGKSDEGLQIKTTGIHIARRIGEAVSAAFKGELQIQYGDGEHTVRIRWLREE